MNTVLQSSKFEKLVKNIPFLACLSDEEVAELKKIIIEKRFLRKQVVFHEEDTTNYLYFIYSGKLKVIQTSIDGKERILAIHKKGDFFGEMAMLDGKTAPATVVALEDCEVGFMSKIDFERFVLKNPRCMREIMLLLCDRLRAAWLMLKVTSFADTEQRMRAVLKNIGDQFGIKDMRGTIIALKLTHKDIAHFASTSRETTTRLLRRFTKAGEIEILDQKYILLKPDFFKHLPFL
jgi:CRP/FNR family cyclic AMP-dependent transcriptional regulator